jgi:hypothetical protein
MSILNVITYTIYDPVARCHRELETRLSRPRKLTLGGAYRILTKTIPALQAVIRIETFVDER